MKERVLTALIALPILILFIAFSGPALFNGLLCLVSALALREFYSMGLSPGRRAEGLVAAALGVILTMGLLFSQDVLTRQVCLVLPVVVMMLVFLVRIEEMAQVGRELGVVVLGFVYVPLLLSHAGLLRGLPHGREWIFLVLCIVMASDTLAYFTGRQWGKRRLYQAVSPNKSVEGAVGGLCGSVMGALLAKLSFFPALGYGDILILGLFVGAFSQIGDLVESLFKRSFGVKDSGALIPGHGGLLDRLDSLLFAFPLSFYYAVWIF